MSDSANHAHHTDTDATDEALCDGVLVIRRGTGANCSSIGSAVEMLFLSAAVGAAVLAAVVAAIQPGPGQDPVRPEEHASEPSPDESSGPHDTGRP